MKDFEVLSKEELKQIIGGEEVKAQVSAGFGYPTPQPTQPENGFGPNLGGGITVGRLGTG